VRGGTKLLLCKVLVGHSFRMSGVETGKPQVEGYDSHISPCGTVLLALGLRARELMALHSWQARSW
jgi:hypothetical protein